MTRGRPSRAFIDCMESLMLAAATSAARSGHDVNVPSGFILDVAMSEPGKPVLKRMPYVLFLEDKKP